MKRYIKTLLLLTSLASVSAIADTDVINKKMNERYTNDPDMHQKVENTQGNSDGFYEHPNNQQHESESTHTNAQVESDASSKVQQQVPVQSH